MSNNDLTKEQVRCLVAGVYDLQKLRISAGNRLVQSFYLSRGIDFSNKSEGKDSDSDDKEKETLNTIRVIRKEYKRLTDGVAEGISVKRQLKTIAPDELTYIKSDMDYRMVKGYMLLLDSEEESIKVLEKKVKEHPLWDNFFSKIKGCGTLMSAMCIAYLDVHKANHASSFYRYCGLDTVQDTDKDGNKIFLACDKDGAPMPRKVREKFVYKYKDGGIYEGKVEHTDKVSPDGAELFKAVDDDDELVTKELCFDENGSPIYTEIETGDDFIGKVVVSEHGRSRSDTEMFEYVDKNGDVQMKRGLTYNPVLKTKLVGVLGGCLLKAKDPVYSKIYYDYRARLDKSRIHKDYYTARKHAQATRYMIKQFLRNLWVTWRDLEGLPVDEPYEVAKLGNKPHHLNDYQCEVAKKYMNRN